MDGMATPACLLAGRGDGDGPSDPGRGKNPVGKAARQCRDQWLKTIRGMFFERVGFTSGSISFQEKDCKVKGSLSAKIRAMTYLEESAGRDF